MARNMENSVRDSTVRKNTVKIEFERNMLRPTDLEMIQFGIGLDLTGKEVHTMYQDSNEYIKFFEKIQLDEFIKQTNGTAVFTYNNGLRTKVIIHEAIDTKYVRVFNLPPEIDDEELLYELEKYGIIKTITREKYSAAMGLPVFSGIRGVNMIINKEIPSQLTIHNMKCRVFYAGIRERCFVCGSTEHKKSDCIQTTQTNIAAHTSTNSYSEVVSNTNTLASAVAYDNTSIVESLNVEKDLDTNTHAMARTIKKVINNEIHSQSVKEQNDNMEIVEQDGSEDDMLKMVAENYVDSNGKLIMKIKKRRKNSKGSTDSLQNNI